MAEFYVAEVRKRAHPDLSMVPEAIPEQRSFSVDAPGAAETAEVQARQRLAELFAATGRESPDDPVACEVAPGVTMEWAAGPTAGQIDFYAQPAGEEPQRFLTLYIFSGTSPDDDRAAMKHLEQYADFRQCRNFPLVLQVTDDPLAAAWQHEALQAMRTGLAPLVAAFLQSYFPAPASPVAA